MELSQEGFLRPVWRSRPKSEDYSERRLVNQFKDICPGVASSPLQESGQSRHPIFGRHVEVWEGWASDDVVRHRGSSGGVLTALAGWIAEQTPGGSVLGVSSSAAEPSRTVPVRITTKSEALAAAGSRYAPVAVGSEYNPDMPPSAVVSKPCEAVAIRGLSSGERSSGRPLLLSFFCAGTPSQSSTQSLLSELGVPASEAASVAYRGSGWPGRFRVRDSTNIEHSLSYEESWGNHLGRNLQWRCKICPDGTGESADVSVGDYWEASGSGYPSFDDAPGRSVVIARSQRGAEVLRACAAAGVIELIPLNLDAVSAVQPLQVERRTSLVGRLLGRRLGGKTIPKYTNYRLFNHLLPHPVAGARAMVGTFLRTSGIRIRQKA